MWYIFVEMKMKEKTETLSSGYLAQQLLERVINEMKSPEEAYSALIATRSIEDRNIKMSAQLGLTIIAFCRGGGQVVFKDWDDKL